MTTRDTRFVIVAVLLLASFLLLPQLALPYDRLDWQDFSSAYQDFVQYLPIVLRHIP
jgi:hypothetical protein